MQWEEEEKKEEEEEEEEREVPQQKPKPHSAMWGTTKIRRDKSKKDELCAEHSGQRLIVLPGTTVKWSPESKCRPQIAKVSSSIPQGGFFVALVLNILLSTPIKTIAGLFPNAAQVV